MTKPTDAFRVDIDSDAVTITDIHGEIVTWVDTEWREDSDTVVLAIAGAIKLCYEEGPEKLRALINHPGERNGFDYRRMGDYVKTLYPLTGYDIWKEASVNPSAVIVAAGFVGKIDLLGIGYFRVSFPAFETERGEPAAYCVWKRFDWKEENNTFIFTDEKGNTRR